MHRRSAQPAAPCCCLHLATLAKRCIVVVCIRRRIHPLAMLLVWLPCRLVLCGQQQAHQLQHVCAAQPAHTQHPPSSVASGEAAFGAGREECSSRAVLSVAGRLSAVKESMVGAGRREHMAEHTRHAILRPQPLGTHGMPCMPFKTTACYRPPAGRAWASSAGDEVSISHRLTCKYVVCAVVCAVGPYCSSMCSGSIL